MVGIKGVVEKTACALMHLYKHVLRGGGGIQTLALRCVGTFIVLQEVQVYWRV